VSPGDALAEAAVAVANVQLVVERATPSAPERLLAPGTVSHCAQTKLDRHCRNTRAASQPQSAGLKRLGIRVGPCGDARLALRYINFR
jgi:hypothetical protein